MIFASFQTDVGILLSVVCSMFTFGLMLLVAAIRLVSRHMANDYRQKGGGTALAKKVAAKGAVEIAKRLFWKRFG